MVKKPHGTEMRVPIQAGNVSKRESIEALTESPRTGKHIAFFRMFIQTMYDYRI
jgi:hypothetical protein